MENLTVLDLRAMIGHCESILKQKGFDDISGSCVTVKECLIFNTHLMDDFQSAAAWDQRYHVGYRNFPFANPTELYEALQAVPSRQERELHFMLKQTAITKEMAARIRSEQARAFADDIIRAGEHYRNLLPAA